MAAAAVHSHIPVAARLSAVAHSVAVDDHSHIPVADPLDVHYPVGLAALLGAADHRHESEAVSAHSHVPVAVVAHLGVGCYVPAVVAAVPKNCGVAH